MNANVRSRPRAAAILFLTLCLAPLLSGRAQVLHGAQAVPAPELDRALRANDLQKARVMVPTNWAAAEQLFVSYLDRAFITPDEKRQQPDARTLAGRLAEVLGRITEYDFHAAVVSTMETADPARRQEILAVVRDHVALLERLRSAYRSPGPTSAPTIPAVDRPKLLAEFVKIADRYRALPFPRGEWNALRNTNNLDPGGPALARAATIADQLGDERYLVRKEIYTQESLAMAERLGLPKHQVQILEHLAVQAPPAGVQRDSPEYLETAVKYRERARQVARTFPPIETLYPWTFRMAAPRVVALLLPALWSDYYKLHRPTQAQQVLDEALEISRPFGEGAVLYMLSQFGVQAGSAGFGWDIGETLFKASQLQNLKASLIIMRSIGGFGSQFQPEIGDKALELALSVADPHERAVTLEWYSRMRSSRVNQLKANTATAAESIAASLRPFPAPYDQLLQLCLKTDEVALTADALASQAAFQISCGEITLAAETFSAAIDHAERGGDLKKAAQVANGAVNLRRLPVSSQTELSGRAIDAATKADDPLELAKALRMHALTGVGARHESFEELQRAVAVAGRYTAESGSFAEERQCLLALANEHVIRGEYRAAIAVFERAADKERTLRAPGATTDNEAGIYQQITHVYSTYLGEPGLALAASEHARQLIEPKTVVSSATQVGTAYLRMGNLYEDLRQPVAALEAWDKAMAAFSGPTPSLPNQRSVLTNRARYLTQLGDYEAALRDLDTLRSLMKATESSYGGGQHHQNAVWLGDVARVHLLAGNRERALPVAREAIAELNQEASDTWVGMGFLRTVVDVLLEADYPDEAIAFCNSYYTKILAMPVPQPGVEKAYLEAVAQAHVRAGRFDDARRLLLSAVDIDRQHPTAEIGGLGASLLALGNLELGAKNYAQATEYFEAAREAANPYDLDRIWQIERGLAIVDSRTGDAEAAVAHHERALAALESAPERLRPEEFRLRYGFDRPEVYDEYAGFLAATAARSGQRADAEAAFQAAERKRTQMLWGLLASGWSRLAPDAMPEQLRRISDFDVRIGAKRALLREQADLPREQRNAVLVEQLETDLKQIQADYARLLSSIAQSQYRYAAPTNLAASLAAPVRAALGSSRALVEYLVMDDRSYAFVVSQGGIATVPLPVGRARLREQVERLLQPFQQLRTGEVDLARLTFDTRAAYVLYQAIFAPLQSALGTASEVLIVPDDVLNVLPFEALVERMPRSIPQGAVLHGEFAENAFLVRRYTIAYLTSSAQLLSSGTTAAADQPQTRLLAMANPTAGRAAPAPAQDDPLKRQLRSARFDALFTPLPGSEAEVARIAQFFDKGAATILTADKATEAAYKSQAGQYDIVHFATHAVASDGQPLYSTLLLAPDGGPGGNDGFLQAYEVLRTPLRAKLVVLSGCETALGADDWGQGLVGLVAAFEQAGARSVLATLWSIDEASAEIMGGFYYAMAQGASTPAALRQAKLQLLQQRMRIGNVEVSLAHPFFWAPFILIGAPAGR